MGSQGEQVDPAHLIKELPRAIQGEFKSMLEGRRQARYDRAKSALRRVERDIKALKAIEKFIGRATDEEAKAARKVAMLIGTRPEDRPSGPVSPSYIGDTIKRLEKRIKDLERALKQNR